jgi:hypothetical protein
VGFDDVVLALVLPVGVEYRDEGVGLVDPVAIDLPEMAFLRFRDRAL